MVLSEYIIVQLILIFWAFYIIRNNPIKSNPADKSDYNFSQYVLVSNILSMCIFNVLLLVYYFNDESIIMPIWQSIKNIF